MEDLALELDDLRDRLDHEIGSHDRIETRTSRNRTERAPLGAMSDRLVEEPLDTLDRLASSCVRDLDDRDVSARHDRLGGDARPHGAAPDHDDRANGWRLP